MSAFKTISPYDLTQNPFRMIGKDWMLITAKKGDAVNTMTASWGGVGVLWNKPVAFLFVRPTRYTYAFLEESDSLTLNFLPEAYRKELSYCGTVSGRDTDKIADCRFTVCEAENAPYFAEAETVLVCKKHYGQMLNAESFVNPAMDGECYADKNYHKLYIAEIEKVLQK